MFIPTLIKLNAKSVPMHISFPTERFIVKYQNIYGMREVSQSWVIHFHCSRGKYIVHRHHKPKTSPMIVSEILGQLLHQGP